MAGWHTVTASKAFGASTLFDTKAIIHSRVCYEPLSPAVLPRCARPPRCGWWKGRRTAPQPTWPLGHAAWVLGVAGWLPQQRRTRPCRRPTLTLHLPCASLAPGREHSRWLSIASCCRAPKTPGGLWSRSGGGSPLIKAPNRPNSRRGACRGWFGPWLGPERPRGRPVLGPENAATVRGAAVSPGV